MRREQLEDYQRTGILVRAAFYLRKSRAEEHMSLEETLGRHYTVLTEYAGKYGYQVNQEDIYKEVVSGESLFARPEMLRLMETVSTGKYDAVLCMDMQRLGRGGMYDQGFILDTFKQSETLIVTPERIYDLTKELDEEAAEMQTFLSRSEYRMITKRLHRGTLQSVQNGAYMANPPFGYQKTRVNKLPTLEIVPEEAECVRQIFQLYAVGNGCTRIERTINAQGFHGRRGSRFTRNTIRQILDNPVYIGKVRWDRTSTIKSGIGANREKKVICNKPDKIKIIDGHHPAIIDQELWDAVQARRKSRYFYVDNHHIANPLAGLVHCSKCGSNIVRHRKSNGVHYMLCATTGCCAAAKYEFVEQAVLADLREKIESLELEISQQNQPDVSGQQAALKKMHTQLEKLEGRRNKLYELLEDGTYSRDVFSQRMQVLTEDEKNMRDAIASLENDIKISLSNNLQKLLDNIKNVLEHYQNVSLPEKKALLQSVILDVKYTKKKKTKPTDFSLEIEYVSFFD